MKKKRSKVIGVRDCGDFVESDRIEWLKQLYAEWLEKCNSVVSHNTETYLMFEPDEFDREVYL